MFEFSITETGYTSHIPEVKSTIVGCTILNFSSGMTLQSKNQSIINMDYMI